MTFGGKSQATIKSLPVELVIMIMERLSVKEALNLGDALQIPEQVAVQYFGYEKYDIWNIHRGLKPSSFKFLLKNKRFQIRATSKAKTFAAFKTLDLDYAKKYLENILPDHLN
jgi:hypothetical protein